MANDKNSLFIKTALEKGYSQDQISKFLSATNPQLEIANPKVIGNEDSNVLNSQSAVMDFLGSGLNAAVDMAKAFPMLGKSVNDLTVQSDGFSDLMKSATSAIDKNFRYTISPDYNKGILDIGEDGSIGLTNFRSVFNGVGQGLGQLGIALGTGGENIWGRLAANTMMNLPSVYESAERAGLNKEDAAKFSLLSPILGATEELGGAQNMLAKHLFGNVATKEGKQIIAKLRDEAITETLEKAAKNELTEEGFKKLATNTSVKFAEKIKNYVPGVVKNGGEEMFQESFQDGIQQGAEQLYDKFFAKPNTQVGTGQFGTELLTSDPNKQMGGLNIGGIGMTKKGFVSLANNGILGGLVGASAHIAIHQNPEFLQETLFGFIDDNVRNDKGESAINRINKLVKYNVENGKMDEATGNVMLQKAQQIYDVADRWKTIDDNKLDAKTRYEAYDLTANVLPLYDNAINNFEQKFKAKDLETALSNIDNDENIDDFQKGALKSEASGLYGEYWKATRKRDVIKSYLQEIGAKGSGTNIKQAFKSIDENTPVGFIVNTAKESIAPGSTKETNQVQQTASPSTSNAFVPKYDANESEGQALSRITEGISNMPAAEQGAEIQKRAKDHATEYNKYLESNPISEETKAIPRVAKFGEQTAKAMKDIIDNPKKWESKMPSGFANGSRIDENGAKMPEQTYIDLKEHVKKLRANGNLAEIDKVNLAPTKYHAENLKANKPTSNQSEIEAKKADIERRRQESKKLVRNAGSAANGEMKIAIHLSPEGKETDRIAVSTTQTDKNFKVTPKIGWEKEIEDWINAKYNAELKAVEQSLSKQESGGKAPVTKPEGKSDVVVDKASNVGAAAVKPKEGHVYRAIDNADDAVGNDKSFSNKTNWYDGEGFLIEAKNAEGKNIEHHEGAKRGNIKAEDVTTVYYEPDGIATDTKTVERELVKMKDKFPNAKFIEVESIEDKNGENQLHVKAVEQSLKENQSESQENNKISSDEQQRAELADIIDAGITENPEGAEEAAILNSLGLSLEGKQGTREGQDASGNKTDSATSKRQGNDQNNGPSNEIKPTTDTIANLAESKKLLQQNTEQLVAGLSLEDAKAFIKAHAIQSKNDGYAPRPDFGLSAEDLQRGLTHIEKGKRDSVAAFNVLKKIAEWRKAGFVDIIALRGGASYRFSMPYELSLEENEFTEPQVEELIETDKAIEDNAEKLDQLVEEKYTNKDGSLDKVRLLADIEDAMLDNYFGEFLSFSKEDLLNLQQSLLQDEKSNPRTEKVTTERQGSDNATKEQGQETSNEKSDQEELDERIASIYADLANAKETLRKAESDYNTKKSNFDKNQSENQTKIFGDNQTPSMFNDGGEQQAILESAKKKVASAQENVRKIEQTLQDVTDQIGQNKIDFKDKSKTEELDDEIAGLWEDLADAIGSIKKFDGKDGSNNAKAFEIGIKLVSAYTKKGIYTLAEISEDMLKKFGEAAKDFLPFVKDAYNATRGRITDKELRKKFNTEDEVLDYELKNNKQDVPNRSRNSKPNSNDTADNSPTSENTDGSNGGRSGQDGVRNSQEDIQDIRIDSSESIHNLFSPTIGEQSDIELRDRNESTSDKGSVTGNFDGRGSRIDGSKRVWTNESGTKKPLQPSDTSTDTSKLSRIEKAKLQKEAESVEVKIGDLDNIKESLPFLLPEQHVDVLKTENRFNNPEQNTKELAFGKGILFTNSTGTGKTFTGLGIAKRFSKQGKNNILIVTPSQAKVSDWQEDGKALSLDISFIENTKDGGKGVVVTTFANFRENKALLERDFDLIIYDESHRLMEDKKGSPSSTTYTHYEMSNKTPDHAFSRISSVNPLYIERDELKKSIRELRKANNDYRISDFEAKTNYDKIEQAEKRVDELTKQIDIIEPGLKERAQNAFENTKVVFLSATPFKAHFNLRYANGFLFNWSENTETNDRGSRVDGESRFYLENFGSNYEWKYHRLQVKPDINPDAVAMQEIEFAEKLIGQGVMSGRMIDSDQDYSREFPRVSGFDSQLFNKAFNDIFDYDKNEFFGLREAAREVFFNYNYTTQLFESLKCSISIPRIKKHIALGRKVVVFHRRQQANSTPPFQSILDQTEANQKAIIKDENSSVKEIEFAQKVLEQIVLYKQKHQEVLDYEKQLNYSSAVDQMKEAFGDNVAFINGSVSTSNKNKAIKNFNTDSSPINVIVIQEEAGKEGISLHDTTGKHQRALINLSMPISTVTALQIEGRIYRLGQQSDAVFEYPLLGLDMETAYFGNNINKRLSTTENLAIGKLARDLIRSYSEGVLFNSSDSDPSTEQGKGGKGYDKKASTIQNDFEKAKLIYATNQKTRGKRDQREGYDFYATPEPLGQKMVEWANLTDGEHALEPSAGNGAIAMWVKPMNALTAIEPSFDLYSKLTARAGGGNKKVINTKFEDFHITNKFDAIVMNPPFGQGGALAIKHIEKAFSQLREGGRIVAIIPSGSMDVKLEKFFNDTDEKGRLVRPDAHLVSSMLLPSSTFSQAGTSVNTRVVIIDKSSTKEKSQQEDIDFRDSKSISELFDSIEKVDSPERAQKPTNEQAEIKNDTSAVKKNDAEKNVTSSAKLTPVTEYINTKTGSKMFITRMATRLSETEYRELNQTAKSLNGFYSSFSQAKGFLFKNIEDAKKFHDKVNGDNNAQFATGNQTASTEQEKAESQAIIDFFKKGLKADVFAPTADFDSMLPTVTNDQKMISESGKVLGFVKDGKIYLNPKTITPQTTFHEIIHIQQSLIEIAAKKGDAQAAMILKRFDVLLGNAVNEIISGKKSVTIDGVKVDLSSDVYRKGENESDAMYRTRVRNELWSYIQAPVNESKWKQGKTGVVERFIEAVKKFFRDKLGFKKADNIQSMTLSELIDTSANSLMKGEYFDSIKNSPQTININGKETTVKNIDAEVVNGFYSPLENIISETKIDKLPAKQWIEKFGKGEEAKWTGLTDWLNLQQGSVSKSDIQQYLKDNRIQVVEVVKDDRKGLSRAETIEYNKIDKEIDGLEKERTALARKYYDENKTPERQQNYQDVTAKIKTLMVERKRLSDKAQDQSKNTKFSQYQLEGEKSKYKEVLVTMPNNSKYQNELNRLSKKYNAEANYKSLRESKATDSELEILRNLNTKGEKFKSSHFDEPNILVHLRMNTRTDAEGKKVLFLEEVQSDWGQKGKKEGFEITVKNKTEAIDAIKKGFQLMPYGKLPIRTENELNNYTGNFPLTANESNKNGFTPTAPFVTDTNAWTKLALKVALKEAVKQGADKIAWTTGEQQNDRYDLSKQVDWINAEKTQKGDYKIEVGHKDNRPMETQYLKENELEPNLGKELATKIINDGGGMYKGLDLKVGGKGMKGFYGSPTEGSLGIVGNVAKSLFKQEPKTVELQNTSTGIASQDKVLRLRDWVQKNKNEDYSYNDAQKDINDNSKLYQEYQKNTPTQHSIDITPEMKAEVELGLPLFAIVQTTKPLIDNIAPAPELAGITKDAITTLKFPLELEKLKNRIKGRIGALTGRVNNSVAVADYLAEYMNNILQYKATNADGTEKRFAFVEELERMRNELGSASMQPVLDDIYEHLKNGTTLAPLSSSLLNRLTEYHIQYEHLKNIEDALVVDENTMYSKAEFKAESQNELIKARNAIMSVLPKNKYGEWISNVLQKYALAVSSLPTWAKLLGGGENSILYKLSKALDVAQDKQFVMGETAKHFIDELSHSLSTKSNFITKDIAKSATEDIGDHFENHKGNKTKISDGELLHIYLTLRNATVRARFFKEGNGIFELKEYRDKSNKQIRPDFKIEVTENDYQDLETKFSTPEYSADIDGWIKANEFLFGYVNETHKQDTGVELRKADGFYYPLIHGKGIKSYADYLKANKFVDDLRSAKYRNPQQNANYLVVDALQVMNNYIDANTRYASFSTPLRNLDVYVAQNDNFFRANNMHKYVEWYNKFKKEFEDPSEDKLGEVGKRLLGGFVISRLGLNPFVTLKQYSSIFVSNTVIPAKYLYSSIDVLAKNSKGVIQSFNPYKELKNDAVMDEMMEHSATARRRLQGSQHYFDSIIKSGLSDFETVVMGKNVKIPFSRFTQNIVSADKAVSAMYWVAAKKQVEAEMPYTIGSNAYWDAVSDIYGRAVVESQSSMDDVNRAHITKDASVLVKGLTLFSGQSFSNFNSFMGNVIEQANNPSLENKVKVGKSVMNIFVMNALMVAAVDSLKYAQAGDDEDKLKKKAFKSLISNSYQNFPILAPILDEVWSKAENPRYAHDINYPVLQVINDGAGVIGQLSNEKYDKAVQEAIKFGAEGIGLPISPYEIGKNILKKK